MYVYVYVSFYLSTYPFIKFNLYIHTSSSPPKGYCTKGKGQAFRDRSISITGLLPPSPTQIHHYGVVAAYGFVWSLVISLNLYLLYLYIPAHIYISFYVSPYISIYLSNHLYVYLTIYLYTYQHIYLSIYL